LGEFPNTVVNIARLFRRKHFKSTGSQRAPDRCAARQRFVAHAVNGILPCHNFPLAFRTFPAIESTSASSRFFPPDVSGNDWIERIGLAKSTFHQTTTLDNAERGVDMRSKFDRFSWLLVTALFALVLTPTLTTAQTRGNPLCPGEDVFFNPGNGENIVVPSGFEVSVFKSGLNFPTAVAFRGDRHRFEVFVLESGHGLPSRCNDETSSVVGGDFSATNPFTPNSLVFD